MLLIEARILSVIILLLPSLILCSCHGHTDECGMLASASTGDAVSIQIPTGDCLASSYCSRCQCCSLRAFCFLISVFVLWLRMLLLMTLRIPLHTGMIDIVIPVQIRIIDIVSDVVLVLPRIRNAHHLYGVMLVLLLH